MLCITKEYLTLTVFCRRDYCSCVSSNNDIISLCFLSRHFVEHFVKKTEAEIQDIIEQQSRIYPEHTSSHPKSSHRLGGSEHDTSLLQINARSLTGINEKDHIKGNILYQDTALLQVQDPESSRNSLSPSPVSKLSNSNPKKRSSSSQASKRESLPGVINAVDGVSSGLNINTVDMNTCMKNIVGYHEQKYGETYKSGADFGEGVSISKQPSSASQVSRGAGSAMNLFQQHNASTRISSKDMFDSYLGVTEENGTKGQEVYRGERGSSGGMGREKSNLSAKPSQTRKVGKCVGTSSSSSNYRLC